MRARIDLCFGALLLLTAAAYLVADQAGGGRFWILLTIATVKAVLIQAIFMQLTRRPSILAGLTTGSVLVGVGVGVVLGAR